MYICRYVDMSIYTYFIYVNLTIGIKSPQVGICGAYNSGTFVFPLKFAELHQE